MKQEFGIGTGASSLMMLFVILTLTTLGVLAFTTATADWRLANRSARMTEAWYAAAADAQQALAQLDAHLQNGGAFADFTSDLCETEADETQIVCTFDAGDARDLVVVVTPSPGAQSERFAVVSHTLAGADIWEEDAPLEVFR